MFDLNWRPIQIKHVHSSVSYQQATLQKYDRHGQESPCGYGPSRTKIFRGNTLLYTLNSFLFFFYLRVSYISQLFWYTLFALPTSEIISIFLTGFLMVLPTVKINILILTCKLIKYVKTGNPACMVCFFDVFFIL